MSTSTAPPSTTPVGDLLRSWRRARRLSQLDLAASAAVSQRHLSFVETGRSRPSREMILHLATVLEVPLRGRNELLVAAGLAPAFPDAATDGDSHGVIRTMLGRVIDAHRPYPALVVDRLWNVVEANPAASVMLASAGDQPNLIRAVFRPDGLWRQVENWDQAGPAWWSRLRAELRAAPFDHALRDLIDEVSQWHTFEPFDLIADATAPAMEVRLRLGVEVVSFITTVVQVALPTVVVAQEWRAELFYPSNPGSDETWRQVWESSAASAG